MTRRRLSEAELVDRALSGARQEPIRPGPVILADEYLQMVRELEGHPDNCPGADKTWTAVSDRAFRRHYARARRRA